MEAFRIYRADNGDVAIFFFGDGAAVALSAEEAVRLSRELNRPDAPADTHYWEYVEGDDFIVKEKPLYSLDHDAEQGQETQKPPNNRRRWTESDIGEVARMYRADNTIAEIAEKTGRTFKSISTILTARLSHIPRHYPGRSASMARHHVRRRDAEHDMPVGEG